MQRHYIYYACTNFHTIYKYLKDRKRSEKYSGLQRGLNPWPRDYRCDAVPTELWSHWRWEQLHKLRSLRRSFLHFHFISTVHIWFISYIIYTHFFHGNVWTHNWPAPNVSGFIAQLVQHRTGNREVTGSNHVEVLNFFQASLRNCINCVHGNDHFFIFISFPQFIYDLFRISFTNKIN